MRGKNWAKPASPTHRARSVSWNSTKGIVRFWTQLPVLEMRAPVKNSRKFR